VSLSVRDFSATVSVSGRRWQELRRRVVRRRLRYFGSGDRDSLFTGIGSNSGLLGRQVAAPAGARADGARGRIAQPELFRAVRPASGLVPTQIAGDLRGGRPGAKRDLALAVNGRLEAVGRSFYLDGDATEHFAFNVPESTLRVGANEIEVFEVLGGRRLRPVARS
jgi:hypothetical protein